MVIGALLHSAERPTSFLVQIEYKTAAKCFRVCGRIEVVDTRIKLADQLSLIGALQNDKTLIPAFSSCNEAAQEWLTSRCEANGA